MKSKNPYSLPGTSDPAHPGLPARSGALTEKRIPFSNALGGGLGTVRSSGPRKQHAQFALCSKVLLVRSPVKIHDA
jgi:hypothetical protein